MVLLEVVFRGNSFIAAGVKSNGLKHWLSLMLVIILIQISPEMSLISLCKHFSCVSAGQSQRLKELLIVSLHELGVGLAGLWAVYNFVSLPVVLDGVKLSLMSK